MTISVHLDTLESAEVEEVGGVIMNATRSFLIDSDSDADWPTDHGNAEVILGTLSDLPAPGDTFAFYLPGLYLISRSVRSRNKRQHDGLLTYRFINPSLNHIGYQGPLQEGFTAPVAPYIIRPSSGLKQVTSDRTPSGTKIEVTHNEFTQIAEVSALDMDFGFRIETVVKTDHPAATVFAWVNTINATKWDLWGGVAKQWLCSDATFKPLNLRAKHKENPDLIYVTPDVHLYIFDFEFKFNRAGWRYEAAWRDHVSARSPKMEGSTEGRKLVSWHPERDFNADPIDPALVNT